MTKISDADFIAAADRLLRRHLDTDGYEIDSDDDAVSRNSENDGAFVKVWVWVESEAAVGAYAAGVSPITAVTYPGVLVPCPFCGQGLIEKSVVR